MRARQRGMLNLVRDYPISAYVLRSYESASESAQSNAVAFRIRLGITNTSSRCPPLCLPQIGLCPFCPFAHKPVDSDRLNALTFPLPIYDPDPIVAARFLSLDERLRV